MFELASKQKFRFSSVKGLLTVEDLWDIPLTGNADVTLDKIAQAVHKEIQAAEELSFVVKKTVANDMLDFKMNIIKHIINCRIAENEQKKKALENKQRKQKLLEILEQKEDQELLNSSAEELRKMLADM
jgi:hypothetical protein